MPATLFRALLLALPVFDVCKALPASLSSRDVNTTCTSENLLVRKEWRKLSNQQKLEYISAVKCLQQEPPETAQYWTGPQSRFDDFLVVHVNNTPFIHRAGQFHTWHRVMVAEYEQDLRNRCGYSGAQPYWDWTLDATPETFPKSPVFDPVYGFGGNGPYINTTLDPRLHLPVPDKTGGGCVQDGPFTPDQYNVSMNYPKQFGNISTSQIAQYNPDCLRRDFSPQLAADHLNQGIVDYIMAPNDYWEWDRRAQGGVTVPTLSYHSGGHLGVGGEIGTLEDLYCSPGDPLFYLHHGNVDRLYWMWQQKDPAVRLYVTGGPSVARAYPYNFTGPTVPYENITVDWQLDLGPLRQNKRYWTIKDVLDTQGNTYCYTYE